MFTFYDVGFFNPESNFSAVTMNTIAQDASIPVTVLYSLDVRRLTGQNVYSDERKNVLEEFLGLLEKEDIRPEADIFKGEDKKEKDTFFAVTKHVLSKLCNSIKLSHDSYQTIIEKDDSLQNVSVGRLGMGTRATWHGYPDARVRAFTSDTNLLKMNDNPEKSPLSTMGDSCVLEGKISRERFNVNQLIATTVVSSFIEHNLHTHLNPLTPVIMLGAPKGQICLYDSENDILLLSDVFDWITNEDNPVIVNAGLMLIWMTIHHR